MKNKVKVTGTPIREPVIPTASVIEVPKAPQLEAFGNDDMHKLVAFVNKLADKIYAL